MTHEGTIRELENLIIYLNCFIAENEPSPNIVNNAIRKLKELDISANIIKTIASIEIEQPNSFFQYSLDLQHFESERKKKNRASIQSMIEILKVEQERHQRMVIEEEKQNAIEEQTRNYELQERAIAEQKEANRISKRALWFSAIATIASVIATVISIIALYR